MVNQENFKPLKESRQSRYGRLSCLATAKSYGGSGTDPLTLRNDVLHPWQILMLPSIKRIKKGLVLGISDGLGDTAWLINGLRDPILVKLHDISWDRIGLLQEVAV